ncbi:MAG TPA: glycosyltransferase [Stellaceae bacterium]|nr:glycosyltransferase [Stellaceae bacterium]
MTIAADRLMVIIPDRLSDIILKGEIAPRYYNPGDLFGEVHIVMLNDDRPDPAAVQPMVGRARLYLHNLMDSRRLFFLKTMGWQLPLIEPLLRRGAELARQIKPQLVRTHNNFLEGMVARRIKRELGIPYVVSLHGVWDVDDRTTAMGRLQAKFRAKLERAALEDADAVIAVYAPIMRYGREFGAKRIELIYNIVAGASVRHKRSYELSSPPRLLTVNRQLPEKNPANIVRAVAALDCSYTLIGDGPLHQPLQALARELGCADRVKFIRSMPNAELCASLGDYDLLVSHCDYWGMSKTIIEGALAGLPIVINKHPTIAIAEYEGGWIVECENSPEGYRTAIAGLLGDYRRRMELGQLAYRKARNTFDPVRMEERTVALYRETIGLANAA